MSLLLYAEDNDGDVVEFPARVSKDTLEVTISAAEGTSASSTIIIDDPGGDFYVRGLKPLYLIETDAQGDEWFGVIGLFYVWNRKFLRGPYRTGAARQVHINVNDVNTLLTRRLQKGTDAKRPQETDVERMTWLVNTAEVIGGGGDSGFTIEDLDSLFTDSPYQMDKTDYTGQDSAGVINDALQDSGKNSYLFVSPLEDQPIRVGIWYGRTEREDYSSPHRISNVLSDIDIDSALAVVEHTAEELIEGTWTFGPSVDAELDRDPSRVASGVMIQYDGGYVYETRPATATEFERRDMLMQAELVKTSAQASRRANRYLRDLRNEDDAITCSVIVPNALVNAFREGHRVQVRFSHLPGYSADFVWMRVANRTVRQIAAGSGLYELALDLRAEEPPDAGTTGSGGGSGAGACAETMASVNFYPLGSSIVSDGISYYLRPGIAYPIEPAPGHVGAWYFATLGAGGVGTWDMPGSCCQNVLRVIVQGNGTLTINTDPDVNDTVLTATLWHYAGGEVLDEYQVGTGGSDFEFTVSTHEGQNCTHWVDIRDNGPGQAACGGGWGWKYLGGSWASDD